MAETVSESPGRGISPQVFTRKASGLVRVMSPRSAIVYTILTMSVILPWTFVEAPTALPGSSFMIGIVVAFVLEIPLALAYAYMCSAMPRSGGDYVFQSRVFGGGIGFTVVFGLFVVWILQWVALGGWLMAVLGLAPMFLSLHAASGSAWTLSAATWCVSTTGIVVISLVTALVVTLLLSAGLRQYLRVQVVLFAGVIVSFAIMLLLFFTNTPSSFSSKMDSFSTAVQGGSDFSAGAAKASAAAGISLNPGFSLTATLLVAPIAWTSLMWAAYSVENAGEIKSANVLRNQFKIILGSLFAVTAMLLLLGWGLNHAVGSKGMIVASSGYWSGVSEATINGTPLMPNLMAIALTASPVVGVLISLGFIFNSFQIVCNSIIGPVRILVAQSLDGLLPDWFSKVSPRWKSPVNSYIAYFVASVAWILAFNYVADWSTKWALGVTVANGITMTVTGLAAALLPYRAKDIYATMSIADKKIAGVPLLTVVGALAFLAGGLMCFFLITHESLGLAFSASNPAPYILIFGAVVISALIYLMVKYTKAHRGIDVRYAFAEVPPE